MLLFWGQGIMIVFKLKGLKTKLEDLTVPGYYGNLHFFLPSNNNSFPLIVWSLRTAWAHIAVLLWAK